MDSTDLAILGGLLLALVAYFGKDAIKDIIFGNDESISITSSGSRDIASVLEENNKDYLVFFGSQTGTAEDYAKKFAKELAAKFPLNVMCADVENYDFDTLNELPSNVIVSFFFSTYGEGDFPDGAIHFEEFITGLNEHNLSNVKFTMFGLGNSTYEFFNGASKKALKYLLEAGAQEIGKYGEGDDGAGTTDEDYLSWKENTMDAIKDYLKLDEQEQSFKPSFRNIKLSEIDDSTSLGEPTSHYLPSKKLAFSKEKNVQTGPFDLTYPYVAPIVKSKELFKSHDRNCIHAEFDISGSNMKYSTGDHLAIWPSNAIEPVQEFLNVFQLDPETVFELKSDDPTNIVPFPCPTTIGAAIQYYMEITGPISRQSLGSIVQFIKDEELKKEVARLSSDKIAFAAEISSKKYNMTDALLKLSGGKPWNFVPWEYLIESIPRLLPRYYSISSSSQLEKQTIHVTAVVENTPNEELGKPTVGVTTNLLRNIQLDQNGENIESSNLPVHYNLAGPRSLFFEHKLPIHVRRSTFRLPTNPQTPVIMIGPGTGIAPFRGFIRERVASVQNQPNLQLGKHLLLYGSRNDDDFLYKDEWPEYKKQLGDSFEIVVAQSRVTDKKIYVQDKLREKEEEVLKLLKEGAFIYICGDAKYMAKDVNDVLRGIISRGLEISDSDAGDMLKMFKTTGKYQEDVW